MTDERHIQRGTVYFREPEEKKHGAEPDQEQAAIESKFDDASCGSRRGFHCYIVVPFSAFGIFHNAPPLRFLPSAGYRLHGSSTVGIRRKRWNLFCLRHVDTAICSGEREI